MTTPTSIPIIDCATCGRRHPVTREHCPICESPSLFSHDVHGGRMSAAPYRFSQGVLDFGEVTA